MAAAGVFLCPEARAESGSSLFAPAAKESTAGNKSAPAPEPEKNTPARGAPVPDGASPHLVVDERGNKTLVIKGEPETGTPTVVVDERGNKTIVLKGEGDPAHSPIVVDERGNKTLVIKGEPETGSPAIVVDERGRKTLVLRGEGGPNSTSITVDESGRKTLVIKGDSESAPSALRVDDLPSAAPPAQSGPSPWHAAPSTPVDAGTAEDRPYWIVDKGQGEDVPYFMEPQSADTTPYWVKKEEEPTAPYWEIVNSDDDGRYWLPKKEKPEKTSRPAVAMVSPGGFAPAIHDASAPASNTREISVYMFKDEKGVVHISNVPADPRFRLFNFTVVDIKVQRGLAGGRMRFTHESLRPYILKAAATYNLDPALIAAIIKSESAFDANAVSWAGAQGLMQLMPKTAREVGCRDPFDPEQNIMGGSRYIRWMLDRFNGNLDLAIAAYNAGPTRVAREWKIPNIAETKNYVVIVKRNYQRYQGEF